MRENQEKHISTIYLSHGGGPMPLLSDAAHQEMVTSLQHAAR
ncbi:MAG: hypothetical protein P8Y65_02225 [Campylobacterales bacterium]